MREWAGSVNEMSVFPTEISVSGLEIFPYEHFSPVNFMLTANGKREFVPRDKVFPLFVHLSFITSTSFFP